MNFHSYLRVHYNVEMKAVEVGDKRVDLGSFFGFGPRRKAIIDSGTTLAYVASDIYEHILVKVCLGKINILVAIIVWW